MVRLIEAGIAAVLIDPAALVVFAPLLNLIEDLSDAAGAESKIQTLPSAFDPVIIAGAVLDHVLRNASRRTRSRVFT